VRIAAAPGPPPQNDWSIIVNATLHFCCRSTDSNPGAATPKSLYDLYSRQATMTGNPYTMRNIATDRGIERNQSRRVRSETRPLVTAYSAVNLDSSQGKISVRAQGRSRNTCSFLSLQPQLQQLRDAAQASDTVHRNPPCAHASSNHSNGHNHQYPLHEEIPFMMDTVNTLHRPGVAPR